MSADPLYAVLRFDASFKPTGWEVISTVAGALDEKAAVEQVVIRENDKGQKTALLGEFRAVRIDNAYTLKTSVDVL